RPVPLKLRSRLRASRRRRRAGEDSHVDSERQDVDERFVGPALCYPHALRFQNVGAAKNLFAFHLCGTNPREITPDLGQHIDNILRAHAWMMPMPTPTNIPTNYRLLPHESEFTETPSEHGSFGPKQEVQEAREDKTC
ncbi:Protein transport protein YOS1, partial [Zalerion maritima]